MPATHDRAAAPVLDRVHLVGVGGAGMSGLARVLLARGAEVSGSDARDSAVLAALRAQGARVHVGHDGAHAAGAGVVVVSTAIRADNPELVAARAAGTPVLHRGAVLAALMAGRRSACVAGTHGKTTTTSMLTRALQHCGADPSFAIGGDLDAPGSNAHHGSGDIFVAEADESDGSFLLLTPEVAIVTNVEADHLDHWGSAEAITEAFRSFAARVQPEGTLVTCADDVGARALAASARAAGTHVLTYGRVTDADVVLGRLLLLPGGGSTAVLSGGASTALRLRVSGEHNVLDATAAVCAGVLLGQPADGLAEALAGFTGVRRRFEPRGAAGGVVVYDDYAHHPTEVTATLRAARQVAGAGRVVAVFQPHLPSRTAIFAEELGAALALADAVVVMDVYAAREDPVPGVTGELVARAVPVGTPVVYQPVWTATAAAVTTLVHPGDLVVLLGAGDVTQLAPVLLAMLAPVP